MSYDPRWEVEGRDWPNREHSRFVEAGHLRWHVQIMGEGPALLLLHGTGAATHSWRAVAPALARRFTIVAPDLPGHGFTAGRPPGGLAMPTMARAVAKLLAELQMEPVAIVGHSAGAAVAARMALDRLAAPRAIIGLSAAMLPFPGLGAQLFPGLARLLFVNPFAPSLFARVARRPGEVQRFLYRSTASRIDAAGVDCYARLLGTPGHCAGAITMMADWDLDLLRRDLPHLSVPLLLAHGDHDPAIPIGAARNTATLIPDARLQILPGLGHLAHEERPDESAAMIADFIDGAM